MIGVVILNYNNAALTLSCMESVMAFNTYPAKFIIVDNASTDGSAEILERELSSRFGRRFWHYPEGAFSRSLAEVSLVCSSFNGGYAQGNNLGLKLAENDEALEYIIILNNDIVFIEDIVPTLVRFVEDKVGAGIVSPLLLKKDGISIDYNCARKDCTLMEIACYYLLYCRDFFGILSKFARKSKILVNDPDLLKATSVPIELPSGSCMLIKKGLFKEIDYFDPNTFLYYEESILYRKLLKKSKTNYLLPDVKCIHLGAQTTAFANRSYSYLKNSNNSAYYYVMHYRNLNVFLRIGFSILYVLYRSILFTKQHLNKLHITVK